MYGRRDGVNERECSGQEKGRTTKLKKEIKIVLEVNKKSFEKRDKGEVQVLNCMKERFFVKDTHTE